MSDIRNLSLGLSEQFECSYLPDEQEQLLINRDPVDARQFEQLLGLGFRRSGSQVYRPHCKGCDACIPVRVPVQRFMPSRSQRRNLARNQELTWSVSARPTLAQQALYCDYIEARHGDGPMNPPSQQQFEQFLLCSWVEQLFIEARLGPRLVLVAVTDLLASSLSATYTFFAPDLANRSLGTRAVLAQIALAQQLGRDYLYLGYQIDACPKMAYKTRFSPLERFGSNGWSICQP